MRRPKRGSLPYVVRTARQLLRDAIRGYRMQRRGTRSDGISTDADERRARLARMGASVGARQAAAKVRTIGRTGEQRKEILRDAAMRSASDVLDVMGNMKGAVMKLAQMASFAVDGLPEGVQQQLAQLQTAAPPMAPELVSDVVTKELGSPPEQAYSAFDMTPMAAASIGQVHRARTHDGRDVAVKVQYPGVDEAIKADLQNADMLFQTVAAMFGGFDPRALLQEVLERMTEEFDYIRESANQTWFADRYRDHAYVKVPDVLPDLTTTRVLTSELIQGRRFYDVLADAQSDKDRFGEIVFRFAMTSIFRDGVFSGDPHPGNYLFLPDGRICFLDFGLVKRFEPSERELVHGPARSVLSDDSAMLIDAVRDLGLLPPGKNVDPARLLRFFNIMLFPLVGNERYRFSRKAVGDAFRQVAMPDSDFRDLQEGLEFPAMLAMFQRYLFGTSAVLGHLEAEANWHAIMRELIFDDAPSSPIGTTW